MAVPSSSYTPIDVVEVASGRPVTVWNQDPATRGRFDTVWGNYSELDRTFHGVDFSASKRMSNRWMLMGSVSLGKTDTDIQGTADLNNPNFAPFRRGVGAQMMPFFFKVAGTYDAPYGISIGVNGNYTSGLPETTTVLVNANTVRLTQVTQRLVVDPRGTVRLPDVKMIDINLRKRFTFGDVRIEPRLDIFNLFNSSAVTLHVEQLGPSYHNSTELLGGRLIKLGFNFNF
jgi:outer membrane receptor protein involved in Fe transport